ncbi:MAG TPA: TadG family pilus assembly protein [Xanthobacteraceae bacterium]|nr:TadG family pilus assembly protein [Xanthobacteraceae bacterium]
MNYVRSFKQLLRDQRGAILVITTIYLPVIVGFMTLAIDMSYVLRMQNMLQVTADSAALAATWNLPNASSVTVAQQYATDNMPTSKYGTVLVASDVTLGLWSSTCATPSTLSCFTAIPTASCTTSNCNAVKVVTRMATANGNPLQLFFASMIGWSNFNVSATAIATYGVGSGSAAFNMEIINDVSASFAPEYSANTACPAAGNKKMGAVQCADLTLMNCMMNSPAGSQLGLTLSTGTGTNFTATGSNPSGMFAVNNSTNQTNLTNSINSIADCQTGGKNIPKCSGSQFAPSLTTSISALSSNGAPHGSSQNIVLITDGEPNCSGGASGCTSDSQVQAAAIAAAQTASQDNISISIVYFCGDDICGSSASNASITFLQKLVTGKGIFLNQPTAAQLSASMQNVCNSTQVHRLVF